MARLFPVLVLTASLLLAGCGQAFVGFVSNPQISSSSVSGIVIVVRLGSANDINGQPVTLTAVTFSNAGLSNSVNFCGDQRSQFPLNQSVRAQFTPGTLCSNLVSVVSL
jgi:hypothetical protein